jgi:penicillin-binding protein 2
MDCNTGAVLAMSSMPDYDCNEPYKLTYDKNKKAIKKIKDKTKKSEAESAAVQNQWRNFTVSDTYVPGSVFKTFIASAALEEKVVNLNTSYTCTGSIQVEDYKMNCHYHAGHGTQNLTQGLENSCNPFFITIGQRLGVHNYFKYFQGFGFTDITGIDLPGEAEGVLPSPEWKKRRFKRPEQQKWFGGETISVGIGQGYNAYTPLQMAQALGAVVNNGVLYRPHIARHVVDAKTGEKRTIEPEPLRTIPFKQSHVDLIKRAMVGVNKAGTGSRAFAGAPYEVGGKTGTAQVYSLKGGKYVEGRVAERLRDHSWFIAFAPADKPVIALAVLVENGGFGAQSAAPIARQALDYYLLGKLPKGAAPEQPGAE